jgi:hypothetical protein
MTDRQRYVDTLLFRRPDRVPLQPGGPRESTLAAWHEQGLPVDVDWYSYLMQTLGIDFAPAQPPALLDVSFRMIPHFEEKELERGDGYLIVQDWMGSKVQISDRYDYTYLRFPKDFVTRKWLDAPVHNRRDWEEKLKWRYVPDGAGRFPEDFDERCNLLQDRETVLQLDINGPFWQLREWCGFEGLCYLMLDDPEFVEELIDFWSAFVLDTLEPILARVTPDMVMVSEDMAYKAHSMISPAMVRRFLMPVWSRWAQTLRAAGCELVAVDSDGYVADLMPLWIEAGFNVTFPVEVAAGNDIVAYRKKYGKQMAFLGGVDKRALAAGGKIMQAEISRVAPLLDEGGFVPGCDHGVPPDISWDNFVAYTRLLATLTGWL